MSGATKLRRPYLILVAATLLFFAASGAKAANDEELKPGASIPSRIPLLDESDLEKFGKSPAHDAQEGVVDKEFPPDTLIPLDTKNLRYYSFLSKVKRKIDQSKYYPKEAVKDMLNGVVLVHLEINRDGSLGEVKVASSSGKDVLDMAALDIVRRAAPFSKVPSRISHTPIRVSTDILFIPTQEAIQRQEGIGLAIPMK